MECPPLRGMARHDARLKTSATSSYQQFTSVRSKLPRRSKIG